MSSPRARCLAVRTNLPVSTLRNPTTVLRAFLPLMMTSGLVVRFCSTPPSRVGTPSRVCLIPKPHLPTRIEHLSYPPHYLPSLLSWSGSGLPSTYFGRFQRKPRASLASGVRCARSPHNRSLQARSLAKGPSSHSSGSLCFAGHPPAGVLPRACAKQLL